MRGGCCGSPPQDPSDEAVANKDYVNGSGRLAEGCPTCDCPGYGAPVYRFGLASANFILNDSPLWLPAAKGPEMAIRMVYQRIATHRMGNYQNVNYYSFGNKWTMNYSGYVTVNPVNGLDVVLPGGRIENFYVNTSGGYSPADMRNLNTFTVVGSQYKFTFHDSQESYFYSIANQYLQRIEDRYGVAINLYYSTDGLNRLTDVTDSLGRSFHFTHNASGFVTLINDSLGRNCSFTYLNGDLMSITDMGGYSTQFQYDNNHWVTSITYPNSSVYSVNYVNSNLYPSNYTGDFYTGPFRMRVTDNLSQTKEYFYHAFSGLGPATVTDKTGNTWAYAVRTHSRSDYYAQDLFYDAVNALVAEVPGHNPREFELSAQQWEYRDFDTDDNLSQLSTANTPTATQMSDLHQEPPYTMTGLNTFYTHDNRHNLTQADVSDNSTPLGSWIYTYDGRDNLTSAQNPVNPATHYGYDAHDRLTSILDALNHSTTLAYDAQGNLTQITDPLTHGVQWVYNANGFNTEIHCPDGLVIYQTPDAVGRVASARNGATTLQLQYSYDNRDRVTQVLLPDTTTFQMSYAGCGLEHATDRLGRTTTYSHDVLGRVNQVTDPLNRAVNFDYNGGNQITKLTTHAGAIARDKLFQYESENGSSRLKHIVSPLGKHVDFTYAFRGNVQTMANTYGTVQYGYDNLLRLTSATFPNGAIGVGYRDVLGNVATATRTAGDGQNCSYTYDQYDALNRVTHFNASLIVPGFANVTYDIGYVYDAAGNVTQRTFTRLATTVQATYAYDSMDRLASVSETSSGLPTATAGYQYDAAGRPWTTTYGNKDQIVYGYDTESRLTSLTIKNGATTLKSFGYVPDAMGNLQSITTDGAQTTYAYDVGYQLIRETLPNGGGVNEWDYDTAGNVGAVRRAGTASAYVVNNDDELSSVSGGATTVAGQVAGGPNNNNKWYNSWADCRGVRARVSPTDGSFSLAGVPLNPGANALQVKVTDVSGNNGEPLLGGTPPLPGSVGLKRLLGKIHGNSLSSERITTLYELVDRQGKMLKWGITSLEKIERRYSNSFLANKKMLEVFKGTREATAKIDRRLVESNPGKLNHEPWAGTNP